MNNSLADQFINWSMNWQIDWLIDNCSGEENWPDGAAHDQILWTQILGNYNTQVSDKLFLLQQLIGNFVVIYHYFIINVSCRAWMAGSTGGGFCLFLQHGVHCPVKLYSSGEYRAADTRHSIV